jgi:hypothetical protein
MHSADKVVLNQPFFEFLKKLCVPLSHSALWLLLRGLVSSFCLTSLLYSTLVWSQELKQFYEANENNKTSAALITDENKEKYQKIIKDGKAAGHLWQCSKNVFLFYDGWVFVGSSKNGSDLGVKPYNLVSNYFVKGNLIRFEFRGLPFENHFELNTNSLKLNKKEPMFHTNETQDCTMLR